MLLYLLFCWPALVSSQDGSGKASSVEKGDEDGIVFTLVGMKCSAVC